MSPTTLLGLPIYDYGLQGALEAIRGFVCTAGHKLVVTLNPEIMVYAHQHPRYSRALQGAALCLPDGSGVVLASYVTRQPLRQGRVTGVDLAEGLIALSSEHGYSVYLVGESDYVLQKATHYFIKKYSNINIVGSSIGPIFDQNSNFPISDSTNNYLLSEIRRLSPDILLVGFGHPKQELWLSYYLPQLPVKVGIGVGGSFDFFAGVTTRAPHSIRAVGLEWLWRLLMQPWRAKRIFMAIIVFPLLVLKIEVFGKLFHVEQK